MNTTPTTRRSLLVTIPALALAGCLNRDDDDEDDSSQEPQERPEDVEDDEGTNTPEDDEDATGGDTEPEDDPEDDRSPEERAEDAEDDVETDDEDDQEDEDEDEDEDEEPQAEERSEDDVSLTHDVFVQDDGTTEAIGTVRNVSEDPIDAVDVRLTVYDADGDEVGSQIETIRGLEPDSRQRFAISIPEDSLRGAPDDADVSVTVYAYGY